MLVSIIIFSCKEEKRTAQNVVTSDIDLFWKTFDKVTLEKDSIKQVEIVQNEYIDKGSVGLEKIVENRNYSAEQYVQLINKYPKYWKSIKPNTLKI